MKHGKPDFLNRFDGLQQRLKQYLLANYSLQHLNQWRGVLGILLFSTPVIDCINGQFLTQASVSVVIPKPKVTILGGF